MSTLEVSIFPSRCEKNIKAKQTGLVRVPHDSQRQMLARNLEVWLGKISIG